MCSWGYQLCGSKRVYVCTKGLEDSGKVFPVDEVNTTKVWSLRNQCKIKGKTGELADYEEGVYLFVFLRLLKVGLILQLSYSTWSSALLDQLSIRIVLSLNVVISVVNFAHHSPHHQWAINVKCHVHPTNNCETIRQYRLSFYLKML